MEEKKVPTSEEERESVSQRGAGHDTIIKRAAEKYCEKGRRKRASLPERRGKRGQKEGFGQSRPEAKEKHRSTEGGGGDERLRIFRGLG